MPSDFKFTIIDKYAEIFHRSQLYGQKSEFMAMNDELELNLSRQSRYINATLFKLKEDNYNKKDINWNWR